MFIVKTEHHGIEHLENGGSIYSRRLLADDKIKLGVSLKLLFEFIRRNQHFQGFEISCLSPAAIELGDIGKSRVP